MTSKFLNIIRSKTTRYVVLSLIIFFGVLGIGGYYTWFSPNTSFRGGQYALHIKTGSEYEDVTADLKPIIASMRSFKVLASIKGYPKKVQAGLFFISKGMSNSEIIETLANGNTPINMILRNSETLERIAKNASLYIEADAASLRKALEDTSFLKRTNLDKSSAISIYLANTYQFFWNTSAVAFRDRMYTEYKRFWNHERLSKAKKMGLTVLEVSSLASIVQLESSKPKEWPIIAGVYINRIRKRMPLQADPTVVFAKKKYLNNFSLMIRRVLFSDLRLDSPYNTYKIKGIPPSPIINPTPNVIDAVLNYEKHDYYYFVADASNPGTHRFSKSFGEHRNERKQYVKWLNTRKIRR